MSTFKEFDPLKAKQFVDTEVAIKAMKRELNNILESYFSWYDPFCELIQNALDSIEEKASIEKGEYKPLIRIIINMIDNSVIVTDNGVGLTKEKYEQFLAPQFSFKSESFRGYKGVGATYIAYGFNYLQVSTKTEDFTATGKMENAKKWLIDKNPSGNPKVHPDSEGPKDPVFDSMKTGVSIYLRFDKTTYPGELSWLNANNANQWFSILTIKTGLGSFFENKSISLELKVIDSANNITEKNIDGISYSWPHLRVRKYKSLRELNDKEKDLYEKQGRDFKMPSAMSKLDAIFDTLNTRDLQSVIDLNDLEQRICEKFEPTVYFCYMYSAKVWQSFNNDLNVRQNTVIFSPGIQVAANNMPQGEILQIPLTRNIGRQNQILVIAHFVNCRADLGRKGFQKEIVDFCKSISRKLIEKPIQKIRYSLKPVTGIRDDLARESEVDEWKDEMEKHEQESPLQLVNENFFLPMKCISITSTPTREQDVIALFNQLIAGGVIRGIRIMSTNERLKYDGMYKIIIEEPTDLHLFDKSANPLGVLIEYLEKNPTFVSKPRILEYKYSLDALIEDIGSGEKNSNDISLVVVWETGNDYKGNYHITSILDEDNLFERQYHGITHIMTNINSGQKEMDLIVLKELIEYLNNREESIKRQKEIYEE